MLLWEVCHLTAEHLVLGAICLSCWSAGQHSDGQQLGGILSFYASISSLRNWRYGLPVNSEECGYRRWNILRVLREH